MNIYKISIYLTCLSATLSRIVESLLYILVNIARLSDQMARDKISAHFVSSLNFTNFQVTESDQKVAFTINCLSRIKTVTAIVPYKLLYFLSWQIQLPFVYEFEEEEKCLHKVSNNKKYLSLQIEESELRRRIRTLINKLK